MRGKEPIDVFLTENKKTDADTGGCHTHAVSRTRAVSTEERGVSLSL